MTGGFNIKLSNLQLRKNQNHAQVIPKLLVMGPLTQPLHFSTANTMQIKKRMPTWPLRYASKKEHE